MVVLLCRKQHSLTWRCGETFFHNELDVLVQDGECLIRYNLYLSIYLSSICGDNFHYFALDVLIQVGNI